jgi:hypothetical protein
LVTNHKKPKNSIEKVLEKYCPFVLRDCHKRENRKTEDCKAMVTRVLGDFICSKIYLTVPLV